MPVSSECIHNKYAPVEPNKLVTCVTGMTSTTKGYGFGSQRSSRFSEDKMATTTGSPSGSRSGPPSISLTSSTSSRPLTSSMQLPRSPIGKLYGSERPVDELVGAAERSRSNPMSSQWVASMGSQGMPRPYTSEELSRRRSVHKGASLRRPLKIGGQASNFGYPRGPSIVVDEELAMLSEMARAARPNTSSFSKGSRTTPSSWVPGRRNKESPGPVYLPEDPASPPPLGLGLAKQHRFAPGVGSYITMSSSGLSPGPLEYRPDIADDVVMPSRATPATFKPRREAGDMNYSVLRAKNPGAKYNVLGNALDTLSTVSTSSKVGFGKSRREQPLSQDFTYMSAPPTANGQRSPYNPRQVRSTGMHAHNQFTSWTD